MPQIGWLEILIIVSIAIIVVGPKDFPLMLKKMGSWIGSIKRYLSDVQNQVSEICLLYTSPSPRDATLSRMPSSA